MEQNGSPFSLPAGPSVKSGHSSAYRQPTVGNDKNTEVDQEDDNDSQTAEFESFLPSSKSRSSFMSCQSSTGFLWLIPCLMCRVGPNFHAPEKMRSDDIPD